MARRNLTRKGRKDRKSRTRRNKNRKQKKRLGGSRIVDTGICPVTLQPHRYVTMRVDDYPGDPAPYSMCMDCGKVRYGRPWRSPRERVSV